MTLTYTTMRTRILQDRLWGIRLLIVGMVLSLVPLLIIPVIGCQESNPGDASVTFGGQTMGTLYSIEIVNQRAIAGERLEELSDSVAAILDDVNRRMSTYDPYSEISRFNQSPDIDWFEISPDFAIVAESALLVCRESRGALDIAVAPLVNLWGFGPKVVPQAVPSPQEIKSAKEESGYDQIDVRLSPPAIRKLTAKVSCDLAAVAKGHAVDLIAAFLDRQGFRNHLVEIGGEIRATGNNIERSLWRVGIKTPDSSTTIQKALYLDNQAMATSGSYLNYFERDGTRYSHLIDPRSGYPIRHNLVSVTVVHESCLFADAMATAINVAGPEEGLELAARFNLAVFLIVRENNQFREVMTPEFERLLSVR